MKPLDDFSDIDIKPICYFYWIRAALIGCLLGNIISDWIGILQN